MSSNQLNPFQFQTLRIHANYDKYFPLEEINKNSCGQAMIMSHGSLARSCCVSCFFSAKLHCITKLLYRNSYFTIKFWLPYILLLLILLPTTAVH